MMDSPIRFKRLKLKFNESKKKKKINKNHKIHYIPCHILVFRLLNRLLTYKSTRLF